MIFRKIYIAIISLFIALSCVAPTESIEATATSITLSLEQTRTQLGEKADGIYPLYWSEGDKISVNGVESAAAVIDTENPSRATFTINGKVGESRHIAYPAASATRCFSQRISTIPATRPSDKVYRQCMARVASCTT